MTATQPAEEKDKASMLAALRAQLGGMADASLRAERGCLSLGDDALDAALPPRALEDGRLIDLVYEEAGHQAAATGFAVALALRLAGSAPLFWCQRMHDRREAGRLYGPGIAALGGTAALIVQVCVRRDADVLWAMEEAIASGAVPVVVGEAERMTLTASRRLTLAAEKSGVTAFFLRPQAGSLSNAAWTRLAIAPAPSAPNPFDARAPGPPRFRLTLQRSRAGLGDKAPRPLLVEWTHETHRFALVAPLADRAAPSAPARAPARLELVHERARRSA